MGFKNIFAKLRMGMIFITILSVLSPSVMSYASGDTLLTTSGTGKIEYDSDDDGDADVLYDAEDVKELTDAENALYNNVLELEENYETVLSGSESDRNSLITALNKLGLCTISSGASWGEITNAIADLGDNPGNIATADEIASLKAGVAGTNGWITGTGANVSEQYEKGKADGSITATNVTDAAYNITYTHHVHSTTTTSATETNTSPSTSSVTSMAETSTVQGGCYQTKDVVITNYSHSSRTAASKVVDPANVGDMGVVQSSTTGYTELDADSGYTYRGKIYVNFYIGSTNYKYKIKLYTKDGFNTTDGGKFYTEMYPVNTNAKNCNLLSMAKTTYKAKEDVNGKFRILVFSFDVTVPSYYYISSWSHYINDEGSGRLNPYTYTSANDSKTLSYDTKLYSSSKLQTIKVQANLGQFEKSDDFSYITFKASQCTITPVYDGVTGTSFTLGEFSSSGEPTCIVTASCDLGTTATNGTTEVLSGAEWINNYTGETFAAGTSYPNMEFINYVSSSGLDAASYGGNITINFTKNIGTATTKTYYKASCNHTNGEVLSFSIDFTD